MKKDIIFGIVMLLVGAMLFLLRATGMMAHIAISVVGIVVMIIGTILTKKKPQTKFANFCKALFKQTPLFQGRFYLQKHYNLVVRF